jgi:hypothetical protein
LEAKIMSSKLYALGIILAVALTTIVIKEGGQAQDIAMLFLAFASLIALVGVSRTKKLPYIDLLTNMNDRILLNTMKARSRQKQQSGLVMRARSKRGK